MSYRLVYEGKEDYVTRKIDFEEKDNKILAKIHLDKDMIAWLSKGRSEDDLKRRLSGMVFEMLYLAEIEVENGALQLIIEKDYSSISMEEDKVLVRLFWNYLIDHGFKRDEQ